MPQSSCAPQVHAPGLATASFPVPLTSGKISTFKSPARTRSSGLFLLPACPISSVPRTAAAHSPVPPSSSTSPPMPLPPAPPPLMSLPRMAIPSPSISTSTTSADLFAPLVPWWLRRQCHHSPVAGARSSVILLLGRSLMRHVSRLITCLPMVLSVSLPASPLNTPLSDQTIREAYFLRQRHDATFPSILGKYIKNLPPPKSGPYISSVTFLTPFIQLVEYSDGYIGSHSAQKALH